MKLNFLSIVALAAVMLSGFSACADKEDVTAPEKTQQETDYTVIFWGSAGNNESSVLSDLAELVLAREEGKITDKVNLVGCLDPSPMYHEPLAAKNLGGILEFELGSKQNTDASVLSALKEVAGIDKSLELDELVNTVGYDFISVYEKTFPAMKSYKANSGYDIYSPASLSSFMAKVAKEHPAKKYVLLFVGHGIGYHVSSDGNAATRSCVKNELDGAMLSLDDVTNAIKNSGVKIQTVVYGCCNMAALENFASMKDVTDYVVASTEPVLGGYFTTLLASLSQAGATDEGMKNSCKKAIDFYKERVADKCEHDSFTSHGFYDLSMTDQLLSSVKKAAAWFESAAKTNPQFMRGVVYSSLYVYTASLDSNSDAASFESLHELKETTYKCFSKGRLDLPSAAQLDEMLGIVLGLRNLANTYGTCFASIMDAALSDKLAAEAGSLDLASLRTIYNEYLSTLKQMAYIRCNGNEANDIAYRFASPSVNLFSMNEQGFFEPESVSTEQAYMQFNATIEKLFSSGDTEGAFQVLFRVVGHSDYIATETLASVKEKYAKTDFDKATGWSKVLENVTVNPLLTVSPTRYDVTCQE